MNGLLALLLSVSASASDVHVNPRAGQQGSGSQAGAAGAVATQPGGTAGTTLNTVGPASLNGTPTLAPAPALTIGNDGNARLTAPGAAPAGSDLRVPGRASPGNSAPARLAPAPSAPGRAGVTAAPEAAPSAVGAALDGAPGAAASASPRAGAPAAASTLGGAARGVTGAGSPRSDGLAERAALDKTFDAMVPGRTLTGFSGATPNEVAGRLQSLRGRVDQTLDNARQAPPADAPAHYAGLLDFLKDKLVPSAFATVEKAVKRVAYAKADAALPELAQASYAAAARGEVKETQRLLKGFDAWEGLLGSPSRPLVSNGAMLAADVSRRLEAARSGRGEPAPSRTLWFERRGEQYVALLPGSAVARLAPVAAGFAMKPAAIPGAAELASAWRAYAADPRAARGFSEVFKGRRARGASVPGALASAARFWLRDVLHRAWRFVTGLFSGGAYALGTPSGAAALRADLALQSEVAARGAAVRAALDGGAPTLGRARAALAALSAQAAAHERLRGRGAASGAATLSAVLESAAAGLPDSEPLSGALAELAFGPDGILRQSLLMSRDAASALDARVFAGAGEGFRHAEGTRLWTRRGAVRLSADLKAAGAGGFIDLRAPGEESVASALAALGFTARLQGGVVTASYDADAAELPADGMKELAAAALEAASGAQPAPAATLLASLRAALRSDARKAQERARALGPLPGARYIGEMSVDGVPYRAYSTGRVSFLRGASGVPAFAAP